jgi:hypothetical protein
MVGERGRGRSGGVGRGVEMVGGRLFVGEEWMLM